MSSILITDTLFIYPEHEQKLHAAGYEIVRINTPNATEDELCEAIKGKSGYILGGLEQVTDKVLQAADQLKVIAFTGTDWKQHISGWQVAKNKNILLSNTPFSNSQAVAEWVLSGSLAMVRNLFALGVDGNMKFITSPGFNELNVGIVGLGHVGSQLANMYRGLNIKSVSYWSKTSKETPLPKLELDELLNSSDIICFCVSADAGKNYIDAQKLALLKDGAIITATRESCVDVAALLNELQSGRIRAFLDFTPALEGYKKLPKDVFYCSSSKTSYNTSQANNLTSDMAVDSLLNLLNTGLDQYKVSY